MSGDDGLTKTVSVPAWMVRLAVWAVGILGAGAIATIVSVVNWVFILHNNQQEIRADVAVLKAREQDTVSAIKSLQTEFKSDMATLKNEVAEIRGALRKQ